MRRSMAALGLFTALLVWVGTGSARPRPDEGTHWKTAREALGQREVGAALTARDTLQIIRRLGLDVFTTPLTAADGFGDGAFDPNETTPVMLGQRPTLQGNRTFLRVNGLDAQSCNECHSIVSHATRPPTLGIGGVGGVVNSAIILPTLIDVGDSSDNRMQFEPGHDPDLLMASDGIADFNGRLANPPFLFGGGGVELLAKEMTYELQNLLRAARAAAAGSVTQLDTHGVHFGSIESLGGGEVELSLEGIGRLDDLTPEQRLVVRPFGRKGENFSMRDFDRGAMPFHFGVQPVEVVGAGVDADGDGMVDELSIAEMSVLHVFDVTNPRPEVALPLSAQAEAGFRAFQELGCAGCHIPFLKTKTRFLPLAFPEVAEDPLANVYGTIDLVEVGFDPVPGEDGVFVPLLADLKRHRMGPRLEESFDSALKVVPNDQFTTARLWGIADTAPYLHDGRAATLYDAIEFHGGEAQAARDGFLGLSAQQRANLLEFLNHLRVPEKPNEELLSITP